jgi:cytochrome c553
MIPRIVKRILFAMILAAVTSVFAAPPAFEDSMAQRTLACTACHGKEGRAGPDGYYPRIAGKPAGYLYNQLLNFRDGRRHYGLMTRLLDPLSQDYLLEVAQYFAALDIPYVQPRATAASPALLEQGHKLALQGDAQRKIPACVLCHGEALTGVQPNTPGLIGLPRDYIASQLGAWRTGQRRAHGPDCMTDIARQLTQDDISAVATWLATQVPGAISKPIAVLPKPAEIACGSAILPAGRQVP